MILILPTSVGQSRTSITLCDLIFHYNLAQLVTFPTHLGGNLLDLVICSPDLSANVSPLSSSLLVSDHYPLSLSFSIPFVGLQKSSTSWFYNYKKTDFDSLNSFLLDYDLLSLMMLNSFGLSLRALFSQQSLCLLPWLRSKPIPCQSGLF